MATPEQSMPEAYIHPSAEVSPEAIIGAGTKIWNWVQVREGAQIGEQCILSKGVYIDKDVLIGNMVKIQNNVSVYHGVTIKDGVFVGPHVCFTNDLNPRAVTEDFRPATDDEWELAKTLVERGASIGANATIIAGLGEGRVVGEFALVAAGSVVTHDVEPFTLVRGNPARPVAKVDARGMIVERF